MTTANKNLLKAHTTLATNMLIRLGHLPSQYSDSDVKLPTLTLALAPLTTCQHQYEQKCSYLLLLLLLKFMMIGKPRVLLQSHARDSREGRPGAVWIGLGSLKRMWGSSDSRFTKCPGHPRLTVIELQVDPRYLLECLTFAVAAAEDHTFIQPDHLSLSLSVSPLSIFSHLNIIISNILLCLFSLSCLFLSFLLSSLFALALALPPLISLSLSLYRSFLSCLAT